MNAQIAPKINITVGLFLTFIIFLLIRLIISYTVLSSFGIMVIDAEFDRDNLIEVFYSTSKEFQTNKILCSQPFWPGKRSVQNIYLKNNATKYIRLDLGSSEGTCKLYSLRFKSFFGPDIVFSPKRIFNEFKPNDNIETFELKNDHLQISSIGNDPFIVSIEAIKVKNFFLQYIFPLIIAFLFWLTISSFSVNCFPAINDLKNKKSSMGIHIGSIDGIRGIAALMVLAEHTVGSMRTIGSLGVWLFFALSGYLLVSPFIHDPSKAFSFTYMQSFILRRLKRIVPMYYTFILVIMIFRAQDPSFLRHLLFLQGDGHLWTIPQEMFFYLLLPFIMFLICLPVSHKKLYCLTLFSGLIWASNTYLTRYTVPLYGYGQTLRPLVGIFLSGALFSYVTYWVHTRDLLGGLNVSARKQWASVLGILLITILILLCHQDVKNITHFTIQKHFEVIGFLSAVFIFLVVMSEDALLGKVMNFILFRALGLVGFSFYLLHTLMIDFCKNISLYYFNYSLSGIMLFIIVGGATYIFAIFTYTLIERPFLVHNSKLT